LPGSVERFPQPEVLKKWMEQAGFNGVKYARWTFDAVALHTGGK
jgi:ubiquinone/menaquinone biosynthesis C-methylase UbiE